jgi:hypothetical protein
MLDEACEAPLYSELEQACSYSHESKQIRRQTDRHWSFTGESINILLHICLYYRLNGIVLWKNVLSGFFLF